MAMEIEIEKGALTPIRFSLHHPVLIRAFFTEIQECWEWREGKAKKILRNPAWSFPYETLWTEETKRFRATRKLSTKHKRQS